MKFSNKHINCLKSIDFDNAQFFIVCYNYILFNLNLFFSGTKFQQICGIILFHMNFIFTFAEMKISMC